MMFLQFFVWGAWYVTAPSYLGTIGFQPADIGNTYSVGPIAGMITPLFVGLVADRFFSAQKVLGILHLLGALIMFGAIGFMQQESPSPSQLIHALSRGLPPVSTSATPPPASSTRTSPRSRRTRSSTACP